MSFTVIGDTVNTASRLQTLTRDLRIALLVSDAVVTATRALPRAEVPEVLDRLEDAW